jgi:hypothetical protein
MQLMAFGATTSEEIIEGDRDSQSFLLPTALHYLRGSAVDNFRPGLRDELF